MSKKHFDMYYAKIKAQYFEMLSDLRDMETLVSENIVSPEQYDNMQAIIQPVKDSYMTMSYVNFLLNQPNKKEKIKKYTKAQEKFLKSLDEKDSLDAITKNNDEQLNKLCEEIK